MITKEQALEIVANRLLNMSSPSEPFKVVDEVTMERPKCWVFFYNSKTFLETGNDSYRLAGNGPVIVNKEDGSVEFLGSVPPVLEVIAEYEKHLR